MLTSQERQDLTDVKRRHGILFTAGYLDEAMLVTLGRVTGKTVAHIVETYVKTRTHLLKQKV